MLKNEYFFFHFDIEIDCLFFFTAAAALRVHPDGVHHGTGRRGGIDWREADPRRGDGGPAPALPRHPGLQGRRPGRAGHHPTPQRRPMSSAFRHRRAVSVS